MFFSINFNQDASLICVSSDHGTVHIFAAEDPKRNKQSRLVCFEAVIVSFGIKGNRKLHIDIVPKHTLIDLALSSAVWPQPAFFLNTLAPSGVSPGFKFHQDLPVYVPLEQNPMLS